MGGGGLIGIQKNPDQNAHHYTVNSKAPARALAMALFRFRDKWPRGDLLRYIPPIVAKPRVAEHSAERRNLRSWPPYLYRGLFPRHARR